MSACVGMCVICTEKAAKMLLHVIACMSGYLPIFTVLNYIKWRTEVHVNQRTFMTLWVYMWACAWYTQARRKLQNGHISQSSCEWILVCFCISELHREMDKCAIESEHGCACVSARVGTCMRMRCKEKSRNMVLRVRAGISSYSCIFAFLNYIDWWKEVHVNQNTCVHLWVHMIAHAHDTDAQRKLKKWSYVSEQVWRIICMFLHFWAT